MIDNWFWRHVKRRLSSSDGQSEQSIVWVDTLIQSPAGWKAPTKEPPSAFHRTACQCFTYIWLSAVWIERHPRTDKQLLVFSVIVTSRLSWAHVWPSFVFYLLGSYSSSIDEMIVSVCACLVELYLFKPVQMKNKIFYSVYSRPLFTNHPVSFLTSAQSVRAWQKYRHPSPSDPFKLLWVGNQRVGLKGRRLTLGPSWHWSGQLLEISLNPKEATRAEFKCVNTSYKIPTLNFSCLQLHAN